VLDTLPGDVQPAVARGQIPDDRFMRIEVRKEPGLEEALISEQEIEDKATLRCGV